MKTETSHNLTGRAIPRLGPFGRFPANETRWNSPRLGPFGRFPRKRNQLEFSRAWQPLEVFPHSKPVGDFLAHGPR